MHFLPPDQELTDITDFLGCIVRDVTARYASKWCTHVRKQRLSEEWWEESLRPYEPSSREEREAEEEDILCKR